MAEPFSQLSMADMRELMTKHKIRFEAFGGKDRQFPKSFHRIDFGKEEGRYSAVVFEDMSLYVELPQAQRTELDTYCASHGVGMTLFAKPHGQEVEIRPAKLSYRTVGTVTNLALNPASRVSAHCERW